ncbi:PREDICTED: uncharacterized protein LOC105954555 [Erythranthe guttata]|uniref:uncharacterized protein LOC105954555 n=1 Tax=Erythranthe guttata TaxID=4155 RepID=UPI00064DF527|nr:PREDICTED: uncharacterized protein LOC105954555 [Erythranthe guttata]|eukprot:XP_012833681.1 PREDICTED: uncharacterized protein LOC105954555 [Erythranthe guttata]
MVFWDLQSFNLALLPKQAWRLISNPDSLLAHILKVRYFAGSDLWSASIGTRPSTTWKSILVTREFLREGTRRRIDDGNSTCIWSDPWLEGEGKPRILTPQPMDSTFSNLLSDLIEVETHTWNRDLIDHTFWPIDREHILQVPLGVGYARDRLIWPFSHTGSFTVGSFYHLIFEKKLQGNSTSSDGSRECLADEETSAHVLCICWGMKDIWESVPFLPKPTESYQSFGSWFDFLSRYLSEDILLSAVVICWKKWDVHNQRLHGSEHLKMNELVGWCSSFLRAFRDAQLPKHSIPRCAASPTWSPPPGGWVKLNVDVALKNGEKFYNTSLVARNSFVNRQGNKLAHSLPLFEGMFPSPVFGYACLI